MRVSSAYLNDDKVCCLLGVLSPVLWDVLAEGVWLERACCALDVVLREHELDWGLAGASCTTLRAVASRSTEVKGLLKRYCQTCSRQVRDRTQSIRLKADAIEACRQNKSFILDGTFVLGKWRHFCGLCSCRFRTKAARAAHLAKKHGVRSKVAAAFGTSCQVCNTEFWHSHRLKQHLRTSADCRKEYFHSDIAGQSQISEGVGCLVGAWRAPSTLEGPKPWWAMLRPVVEVEHESTEAASEVPVEEVTTQISNMSIRDRGFVSFCEGVLAAVKSREALDCSLPEGDQVETFVARSLLSHLQGVT